MDTVTSVQENAEDILAEAKQINEDRDIDIEFKFDYDDEEDDTEDDDAPEE
jgi:hypothetical protein